MRFTAIAISYENQCSWSLPIDTNNKAKVLKALCKKGRCKKSSIDEILLVDCCLSPEQNMEVTQWSQVEGHF